MCACIHVCLCTLRDVCEGDKNSRFTYLEVAPGSWAAAPCWEAPVGGLGKLCQVVPASCPASGVSSFSFPPAPFGSCRSSLPEGGSTPPRRDVTRGREDVTGYIATLHKTNTCFFLISSSLNWKLVVPQYLTLCVCWFLTLLLADSYMSPSTFRA